MIGLFLLHESLTHGEPFRPAKTRGCRFKQRLPQDLSQRTLIAGVRAPAIALLTGGRETAGPQFLDTRRTVAFSIARRRSPAAVGCGTTSPLSIPDRTNWRWTNLSPGRPMPWVHITKPVAKLCEPKRKSRRTTVRPQIWRERLERQLEPAEKS